MSSAVSTSSLSEYLQLQSEMRRMDDLLTSIRKQSSSLLLDSEIGGYGTCKNKALSLQKKRELSASSWAKSSTVRKETGGALSRVVQQPQQKHIRRSTYIHDDDACVEEVVTTGGVEDTAAVADLVAVDRYLKTSAPRYTMGQRRNSGGADGIDRGRGTGGDTVAPGQYEPSIDQLSTSKRARTCTFSTTPRPFSTTTTTTTTTTIEVSQRGANTSTTATSDPAVQVAASQADGDDDHASIDDASTAPDHHGPQASAYPQQQHHHRPSKGVYSFGKQSRFSAVTASSNAVDSSPAAATPLLDLDRAERAILPHSSSMRFVLPMHHKRGQYEEEENGQEGDSKSSIVPTTTTTIDGLSYRTKVTNITSMHSTGRRTRPPEDVPGPGAYSSRAEALSTHRRASSACRYHSPVQLKNSAALTHKLRCEQDWEAQIGPGMYYPDKGLEAVSCKTPVLRIHPAESKSTPQLKRRAYFEQKAKDMREAHDFMRDSSLALLSMRTPQVHLAAPKTIQDDPRRHRILVEHRLKQWPAPRRRSVSADTAAHRKQVIRMVDQALHCSSDDEDENIDRPFDDRFAPTERRVKLGVKMQAEVSARKKTSDHLLSRPGVMARVSEKRMGPLAAHRLYGPQLPVRWVPERLIDNALGGDEAFDGYDSPTEAIVGRLLSSRNPKQETSLNETKYTTAFLDSSYSGSLVKKKPAVIMIRSATEPLRRVVDHHGDGDGERQQDFIGPQLQPDWTTEVRSQPVRMDLVPGRERIKLHRKGEVEVVEFGSRITPQEVIGPGYYDADSHLQIAHTAEAAKGVPFSKGIGREDQVGVHGQRPAAAVLNELAGLDADNADLYISDQLDIDYGRARDTASGRSMGQFKLYIKDRYSDKKEEETELNDHLGGSWFEGMHELSSKKPNWALDFSKQTKSRSEHAVALEDPAVHAALEEEAGPIDGRVAVEVSDWHPHRRNPDSIGFKMQDPLRYPRFKEPKENTIMQQIDVEDDEDYYSRSVGVKDAVKGVNMDKMLGREDSHATADATRLMEVVGGEMVDASNAIQVAAHRDKALDRASMLMSGQKRIVQSVNMDKQLQRVDPTRGVITGEELVLRMDNGDAESNTFMNVPQLNRPATTDGLAMTGKGVMDWSKGTGRPPDGAEDSRRADPELLYPEQLILHPEAAEDGGSSKYKKVVSLPKWDKGALQNRFKGDEEQFMAGQIEMLDLQDVDPGRFKKGMQGFAGPSGSKGGALQMDKQTSRPFLSDELGRFEDLQKVGLLPDEVLLSNQHDTGIVKPRVPSTRLAAKGKVDVDSNAARAVLKDLQLNSDDGLLLKLNPITGSDYLQTKPVGVSTMKDKAVDDVRATVHDVRATQELRVTFEEQVIVKTTSDLKAASNRQSFARHTRDDRQSSVERAVEAQVLVESEEQLKISRTDPAATTRRVPGGSSLRNRSESSKQSAAQQRFLRDSSNCNDQEVVVKASNAELTAATRVTPVNAAAIMKSAETRISSSKTLQVESQLRTVDTEELLLNPQLTRDARGATSISNSVKTTTKAIASTKTLSRSSSAVKKSTTRGNMSVKTPGSSAARLSSDPKRLASELLVTSSIAAAVELPPDAPEIAIPAIDHRPPPSSSKSLAQYSNMTDNQITDLIDSNLNKLQL